ncbi:pyruvate dehydrogenase (acetyl-transferring) E1 component subunit alpha [Desulforhopalus singaporensis]|uniref:Pyruvate dehydrogenase E1 component subunit alpha n=1 Tax=Desulforhopalus singaporensis TaxID=91360 RepID=A0A1H0JYC0_9BACT|nr:pyruvate dehydrogenase (acetyl-transferring) E1 component subunit alpha [Desulforhopalus singaporensis]SDO48745.1 pyruvate dehydrogenase E1 component alpha subunit [Desulforhopalus singaporensis]
MGRNKLDINHRLDYLSILDENGVAVPSLEPDIDEELHLKMYRFMLLGRLFDERMLALQRQGRIGTFPPISGQEAAQIGSVALLKKSDWFVPSFRETAAELMRGRSMENVLLYYNGYNEGTIIPPDQKDLPMSVPVASQILHAVGIGWAAGYRNSGEVVMTFFGDGATSEGDFHEGLNCASVYNTPVVFICQNNQWAISVPIARQTHSTTLVQKALAYDMAGIQVDGNDILAVYSATREAVERARRGDGPTLIECVTYRVMMHTTADDPKKYRSQDEVESWRARDPLTRYRTYLLNKSILTPEKQERLEREINDQIEKAVATAELKMKDLGDPLDMFDHLYQSLSPELQEQKKNLATYLETAHPVTGGEDHG